MLMQEQRYRKHIENLKNMRPMVNSGLNIPSTCVTNRGSPMNSTMYSNRISVRNDSILGKEKEKKRRNIFTSNSPRTKYNNRYNSSRLNSQCVTTFVSPSRHQNLVLQKRIAEENHIIIKKLLEIENKSVYKGRKGFKPGYSNLSDHSFNKFKNFKSLNYVLRK